MKTKKLISVLLVTIISLMTFFSVTASADVMPWTFMDGIFFSEFEVTVINENGIDVTYTENYEIKTINIPYGTKLTVTESTVDGENFILTTKYQGHSVEINKNDVKGYSKINQFKNFITVIITAIFDNIIAKISDAFNSFEMFWKNLIDSTF